MVVKYKESYETIKLKLIYLIQEEESIINNVSDFIYKAYMSEDANLSQIAVDTLILLTNYSSEDKFKSDSQAIKNT